MYAPSTKTNSLAPLSHRETFGNPLSGRDHPPPSRRMIALPPLQHAPRKPWNPILATLPIRTFARVLTPSAFDRAVKSKTISVR